MSVFVMSTTQDQENTQEIDARSQSIATATGMTTKCIQCVEDTGNVWGKTCARVSRDGQAHLVGLGAR